MTISNLAGAPEEIRTPDPQIRSRNRILENAASSCKPGGFRPTTIQGVTPPIANRFDQPKLDLKTREEAAKYLLEKYGFGSVNTLAHMAMTGKGPAFYKAKHGHCRYPTAGLDEWAVKRLGPLRTSSRDDTPTN